MPLLLSRFITLLLLAGCLRTVDSFHPRNFQVKATGESIAINSVSLLESPELKENRQSGRATPEIAVVIQPSANRAEFPISTFPPSFRNTEHRRDTSISAAEFSAALSELLEKKSSAELAEFAGGAVRKTTLGLIAATSGIIDGSISFLSSSEAEQSWTALGLSFTAASLAGKSLLTGFTAATAEWELAISTNSDADKPNIELILKAINKVVNSTEFKKSISEFGDNAAKSAQGLGTAGSLAASGLSKQVNSSPKWNDALRDIDEGLVMLNLAAKVFRELQGHDKQLSGRQTSLFTLLLPCIVVICGNKMNR